SRQLLTYKGSCSAPFFNRQDHFPMSSWLPSAPRSALVARQKMYQTIREYFLQRAVLEVETPLLCTAPVADPNITPMQVEQRWLHTSPEYAMKRMLCAGY